MDICVNFTGGDTWNSVYPAHSSRMATLLTCGATAGFERTKRTSATSGSARSRVCGSNGYTKEDVTRGMVEMAEGKIKKPPIREFPLAKLGEAEAVMEARDSSARSL